MIDKQSKIPLYQQIRQYLENYINNPEKNTNKLPSENELSRQFNISRPTVREAIDDLVHDGLVEKIPGKGTFIKTNRKVIRFANWQSTEAHSAPHIDYISKQYEKNHSNQMVSNDGYKYRNIINTLIELTGFGNAPDVMSLSYLWIPLLANNGALYDLTEFYTSDFQKKLYPQSLKTILFRGNYYGFNWINGPHILYYNKNILMECFGKEDPDFQYYDEMVENLQQIYVKYTGTIIPFCLPFISSDIRYVINHFIYIFLFSFNGGIINDAGEIIFNSENNIKAFAWLKSFISKGFVELNLDLNSARKKFADNKMAFWIDGPWYKNMIPSLNKTEKTNIGFRILPRTPTNLAYSTLANHVLSVSNQCKDKESAIEFAQYITMDKKISAYYYQKTGMFPASLEEIQHNPVYNDAFGIVIKKQMETALPIPDTYPGFTYAMNFCMKACREIFIGNQNIISVLNNTAESIKEIYNS